MKRTDSNSQSYAEYNEDSNKNDPKFKVANNVRISKYKNIFSEGYAPNSSDKVFLISKIKRNSSMDLFISDLNGK